MHRSRRITEELLAEKFSVNVSARTKDDTRPKFCWNGFCVTHSVLRSCVTMAAVSRSWATVTVGPWCQLRVEVDKRRSPVAGVVDEFLDCVLGLDRVDVLGLLLTAEMAS